MSHLGFMMEADEETRMMRNGSQIRAVRRDDTITVSVVLPPESRQTSQPQSARSHKTSQGNQTL